MSNGWIFWRYFIQRFSKHCRDSSIYSVRLSTLSNGKWSNRHESGILSFYSAVQRKARPRPRLKDYQYLKDLKWSGHYQQLKWSLIYCHYSYSATQRFLALYLTCNRWSKNSFFVFYSAIQRKPWPKQSQMHKMQRLNCNTSIRSRAYRNESW